MISIALQREQVFPLMAIQMISIGEETGEIDSMLMKVADQYDADVRKAAKDWQTFSSDVPFRVPIPSEEDVRSMRQLPIETNPPEHTDYRAIVAQVPFVDVVTTMLDESIPLTTNEFDEWGDPKKKQFYEYMLSYSPYDNVSRQAYPAMLVTTGLHDSQVQYWEPAKWVARLRTHKTDSNPLLYRTTMEAGHGGKSGRFQRFREIAEEYAFILDQSGLRE